MTAQQEPRYRMFEKVRLRTDVYGQSDEYSAISGMIVGVRRYPAGNYVYEVGSLDDDEDLGGLFDEDDLESCGEFGSPEGYGVIGPFRVREVVRVKPEYREEGIGGYEGVVDGTEALLADGKVSVGIWIDALAEGFSVPEDFLVSAGRRRPPRPVGETATSLSVSESGEVLGSNSYVLVDDIDRYV